MFSWANWFWVCSEGCKKMGTTSPVNRTTCATYNLRYTCGLFSNKYVMKGKAGFTFSVKIKQIRLYFTDFLDFLVKKLSLIIIHYWCE